MYIPSKRWSVVSVVALCTWAAHTPQPQRCEDRSFFLEKVRATARKNQYPQNALERCVWECFIATFTLKFCHFWNQTAIMHRRHVKLGIVQPRDCPQFDLGSPRLKCWDMFSVFFTTDQWFLLQPLVSHSFTCAKASILSPVFAKAMKLWQKWPKHRRSLPPKGIEASTNHAFSGASLFRMCCGRRPNNLEQPCLLLQARFKKLYLEAGFPAPRDEAAEMATWIDWQFCCTWRPSTYPWPEPFGRSKMEWPRVTCTMYVVRISNDNLSTSVIDFMFFSMW